MALTTSRRVDVAGRPPGLGGGTCGAISFHWALVRPVRYGVLLMPGSLPSGPYWTSSQGFADASRLEPSPFAGDGVDPGAAPGRIEDPAANCGMTWSVLPLGVGLR